MPELVGALPTTASIRRGLHASAAAARDVIELTVWSSLCLGSGCVLLSDSDSLEAEEHRACHTSTCSVKLVNGNFVGS